MRQGNRAGSGFSGLRVTPKGERVRIDPDPTTHSPHPFTSFLLFPLMASLARLRSRLPLKATGRFPVSKYKKKVSHTHTPYASDKVFCALVADLGRLDATHPINTRGWLYAILRQAS